MIEKLAEAIATMEGFYKPGSVANRLNNPGNLVYAGQRFAKARPITGADGKVRTYCKFEEAEEGWKAMHRQLRLFAGRGLTLLETIQKWAPREDGNDPDGYAAFVARRLGSVDLETPLREIIG
jgi:hypothetical protein